MSAVSYTVVVAEDEELLLNDLVKKIEAAGLGFEVIGKAQTGKQALELVNELSPNLIISDIRMPMMDGVTLLEQVHDYFPYIRAIIVSGFSDFDYARRAISIQVSEYILKPIDPNELYQALLKVKAGLDEEQEYYASVFDESWLRSNPEQLAFTLKNYIQNHFKDDINLNVIAQKLNYSSAWLTKIFCQYYDTTPSRYLMNLRIAQAKNLLAHNHELSIKQIGEMAGYQDQGYFSRIFKKNTGLSPVEYRESLNQRG